MYIKFVKFGRVVLSYGSGQTDRQTHSLITKLRTPIGDEVKCIFNLYTKESETPEPK